jgi:hypothetical protein
MLGVWVLPSLILHYITHEERKLLQCPPDIL